MLEVKMRGITWPKCSEKVFVKTHKKIKNEVRSEEIENLNNYIIAHPIKEESESVKIMVS